MTDTGAESSINRRAPATGRSLTDQTLHGFFWVFAGNSAQALLKISVTIVLARLVTPAEFGVVGAALIVIGFCQIFSQLGVGPAIVQRPALTDAHLKVAFTLSLATGAITGLAVYFLAPVIGIFFRMPELVAVVRVLAWVFPIAGLGVVAESMLRRTMQFKQFTAIEVVSFAFGYGLIGIVCALLGWGIWALVAAQLAQTALQMALVLKAAPHPKGLSLQKGALGQLLHFGAGFSLAKIGNFVALQVDNLVVGRWLGAEALGIYGRAYQFMMLPTNLFGKVVDNVLFPSMAVVQQDPERLGRAYLTSVGLVAMITLPVSSVLAVLSPEIITTLLGQRWSDVVGPFQIFAVVLVFRTTYKMSDTLVRATGAVYSRAWRQWIYAVLVFLGAYAGSRFSLEAVALGVSIAIVINFLLMFQLSVRLTNVTWRSLLSVFLRHTGMSAPVFAAAWLAAHTARGSNAPDILTICASLACAGLAFSVSVLLFGQIYGEEGKFVARVLKKYSRPLQARMRGGDPDLVTPSTITAGSPPPKDK